VITNNSNNNNNNNNNNNFREISPITIYLYTNYLQINVATEKVVVKPFYFKVNLLQIA